MQEKSKNFETNPEKAASRVAINGVMLASIFVMLAVIFLDLDKFRSFAVIQMVMSIPFLFVSSLAYSKIGYWKQIKAWDIFGYFTNTIGNLLMLNSIGLISTKVSENFALIYFLTILILLFIYSVINIYYTRSYGVKIFKFLFSVLIIIFGGILPLYI